MTIETSSALQSTLETAGTEDNPFVAHLNIGTDATITTSTGTEVSAAANIADLATYSFWSATPNGSAVARAQFVFASPVTLGFVGIAAHNLADVGGTVKPQYSTDSGSSWLDAGDAVTPTDNQAIGWRFADTEADYWRISCTGLTDDVVIGVALLSEALIIPEQIYQGYAPPLTPNIVDLQSNVSEGNHLLGTTGIERGSAATAAFDYLAPAFVRGADWLAFQRAWNRGAPAFWAWRPDSYGDLFLGWRTGGAIAPVNSPVTDRMSLQIAMRLYDEP